MANAAEREHYLANHPELVSAGLVERLEEDVRNLCRTDLDEATRKADAAAAVAEALGAPECLARALRARANVLRCKGHCRPAVDLLDRAAALFAQGGKTGELGRTLSTSIQPLILLGDYARAWRTVRRARRIFADGKDRHRLARLELNAANIHHRLERYADALAAYERAYVELREVGDLEGVGAALHNMAVCLISLDQFDRGLELYQQACAFSERNGMPLLTSQAEYNIAYLYYLRGDYEPALGRLHSARETFSRNGDSYHVALCNLDLSDIYLELNLNGEAEQMARDAAGRFGQLGVGCEAGRSLANMAIAASRRGDRGGAVELFARSREVFAREGHRAGESMVDLYRAILLFESGDLVAAANLCLHACEFFNSSGVTRKAVLCELLLSRIALAEGDLAAAHERCQAALDALQGLTAPVLEHYAYLQAGRVREAEGDSLKAYEAYCDAHRHLEMLRSSLQGEELRIAFMDNRLEVYERLTGRCLERGLTGPAAAEAFGYIEQAKCRCLLDALFGRATPLPVMAAEEDGPGGRIRTLRRDLNWYYHRIEREQMQPGGISPERISRLWAQAREREESLLRTIREMPATAVDRVGREQAVTTSEIQSVLDADTVLVEYFQVGEQYLAALLTRTSVEILPLTTESRLRKPVQLLQFQLAKCRLGTAYSGRTEAVLLAATNRHLQELYDEIMAPVRSRLTGRHIIFVPHGVLHHVPLHALFDGTGYLIDHFTVSYAPSASILTRCGGQSANRGGSALVLGVGDGNAPWILREAQEVAAVVPYSRLLLGAEASVQALRELGPQSRQIHIATHGVFRGDNPMFSAVRLGDAYLSLYDLYSLRLPVDLLALSGCATGLGVVAAGDEKVGLSRGLLYAGARTLLLTLWDVHDRSTAEVMLTFYLQLRQGSENRALALKTAMLEARRRYPHPFHWAPFILVGKAP
jgi:CHAT domain-containing protein/tetratricopeptide (TPR) repeat protein